MNIIGSVALNQRISFLMANVTRRAPRHTVRSPAIDAEQFHLNLPTYTFWLSDFVIQILHVQYKIQAVCGSCDNLNHLTRNLK